MSPSENQSSYNLRPRTKVVVPNLKHNTDKFTISRQEKKRMQQLIDERAKQPMSDTDGPAARFLGMGGEELKKFIQEKLDALGRARNLSRRPPESDEERARVREEQERYLTHTGLSYLNQSSTSDTEYELVGPRGGRFFLTSRGGVTHFNFEAKLKNDPHAKPHLFFLEIVEKKPGAKKVTHCRSLGLSGSKAAATGPNGCHGCLTINHPKGVRFVTC